MREVVVKVTVQYRTDGSIDRGKVRDAVAEALLGTDRAALFANGATYAGYSVALEDKPKPKKAV